jgi:hypothetical protein
MDREDLEEYGFDVVNSKVNVLVNVALISLKQMQFTHSLETAYEALRIQPNNQRIVALIDRIKSMKKEYVESDLLNLNKQKITPNHPNMVSHNKKLSQTSNIENKMKIIDGIELTMDEELNHE